MSLIARSVGLSEQKKSNQKIGVASGDRNSVEATPEEVTTSHNFDQLIHASTLADTS